MKTRFLCVRRALHRIWQERQQPISVGSIRGLIDCQSRRRTCFKVRLYDSCKGATVSSRQIAICAFLANAPVTAALALATAWLDEAQTFWLLPHQMQQGSMLDLRRALSLFCGVTERKGSTLAAAAISDQVWVRRWQGQVCDFFGQFPGTTAGTQPGYPNL